MLTKTLHTSVLKENPIPLAKAAKRLPSCRRDRPIHPSTLNRWATRGARASNGQRVRLETARIGGVLVTSAAAIDRFIAALSERPGAPGAIAPRTPTQRQRSSERAAKKCVANGF